MNIDNEIFAFVLMPFDNAFDDIYKLGIKETATSLGIVAERVDEQIFQEGILERIYRQIELADLVVADMTGQNPNVFYEVGYAHAKGKLCVLLTQRAEDIPFDLKHHRHIVYGSSIAQLRTQLAGEMEWARKQIATIRSSRIKVSLKDVSGLLEKSKLIAWGIVDFKFDLHNETTSTSAEIDAIYFYANKDWTLQQDGRECPSTDSDLPPFPARHFLTSPVRRLNKHSWAQLKFSAKRILALGSKGQELKDSYRVTGRSLIRLVTVEGNFDYEFPLDVSIDEVPF
jgi:nucleoside 2-deoxyribosyltransferase